MFKFFVFFPKKIGVAYLFWLISLDYFQCDCFVIHYELMFLLLFYV